MWDDKCGQMYERDQKLDYFLLKEFGFWIDGIKRGDVNIDRDSKIDGKYLYIQT